MPGLFDRITRFPKEGGMRGWLAGSTKFLSLCALASSVWAAGGWVQTGRLLSNGGTRDVAASPDRFVGLRSDLGLITSTDGREWTGIDQSNFPVSMFELEYGNGRFVALGWGGVAVSLDGLDWQFHPLPYKSTGDLRFLGGLFVTTFQQHLHYSADGVTWTAATGGFMSNTDMWTGADNGTVSVVGGAGPTIYRSTDSRNWQPVTIPGLTEVQSLIWTGSHFVASAHTFANSAAPRRSVDGLVWTVADEQASGTAAPLDFYDAVTLGGTTTAVTRERVYQRANSGDWDELPIDGWSHLDPPFIQHIAANAQAFVAFGAHGTFLRRVAGGSWEVVQHSTTGQATPIVTLRKDGLNHHFDRFGVFRSADGIGVERTPYQGLDEPRAIVRHGGEFFALDRTRDRRDVVRRSSDGVAWTSVTALQEEPFTLVSTGTRLIAISPVTNTLQISEDGLVWNKAEFGGTGTGFGIIRLIQHRGAYLIVQAQRRHHYESSDGGATWQFVETTGPQDVWGGPVSDGQRLVRPGKTGILALEDGSNTWQALSPNDGTVLEFVDWNAGRYIGLAIEHQGIEHSHRFVVESVDGMHWRVVRGPEHWSPTFLEASEAGLFVHSLGGGSFERVGEPNLPSSLTAPTLLTVDAGAIVTGTLNFPQGTPAGTRFLLAHGARLGSVTVDAMTGSFTYRAGGEAGTDSVLFHARTDSGYTNLARTLITVRPTTTPPPPPGGGSGEGSGGGGGGVGLAWLLFASIAVAMRRRIGRLRGTWMPALQPAR